ncbi:copper amine oxidase N-terminal domain-containing protein [Anoxynatronum sibiricum]|uniref:Copper amine oxidase N-terminal domain-containing protein n=1 Tax=Anoxynatronum sibiricum TaxID=210623 RepID=A0ABU9VYT9_9CLOT
MRKNIALVLALVMILSLIPMSAFAASTNRMVSVPMVRKDQTFAPVASSVYAPAATALLTGDQTAPLLGIEEKRSDFTSVGNPDEVAFRLRLNENAEWPSAVNGKFFDFEGRQTNSNGPVSVSRLGSKEIEVSFSVADWNAWIEDNDRELLFPIVAKVTGTGDAVVTIDPWDNKITGGSLTFATVGTGKTTSRAVTSPKFTERVTLGNIMIDETSIGTLSAQEEFTLTLPRGFYWANSSESTDWDQAGTDNAVNPQFNVAGGFRGNSVTVESFIRGSAGDNEERGEITRNPRVLVVQVDGLAANQARGTLILQGLEIVAERDARFGDVEVTIEGLGRTDNYNNNVSRQNFKVAERVDWLVKVSVDGDPTEILAGYLPVQNDGALSMYDDEIKMATIIIEEEVPNAWLVQRTTVVELPSWASIANLRVEEVKNMNVPAGYQEDGESRNAAAARYLEEQLLKDGEDTILKDNKIEFSFPGGVVANEKGYVELTLWVTARANAAGEITAQVTGRSMPQEQTVVIGEAIAPVMVEVEPQNLVIGIQDQILNDIVITEARAGALNDDGYLVLALPSGLGTWKTFDTILVDNPNEGVEIDEDEVTIEGNMMYIPIENAGYEASKVTVVGATVTLNRTPAKGDYSLSVGGFSLVRNNIFEGTAGPMRDVRREARGGGSTEFFRQNWVVEPVVATVVSPTTDEPIGITPKAVSFTVGQTGFTVNGEMNMMDVAPYISNDRLMIPVRYLEDMFGSKPQWNEASRTVTVVYKNVVYGMTIGSNVITANGAPFSEMDATAEIVNGRTFVPASRFARAMGVEYTWDAASQTATFQQ